MSETATDDLIGEIEGMLMKEVFFWKKFQELIVAANDNAIRKGFWEEDRPDTEALALISSEISEALESDRKGGYDDKLTSYPGRDVELADVFIRVFDTCRQRGFMLMAALRERLDSHVCGNGDPLPLGDWVGGFNAVSDVFSKELGTHTSFATDIMFAHCIAAEVCGKVLDGDDWATTVAFADLLGHIMGMSAKYNLRVAEAIIDKMLHNAGRPYKHGKKY